MTTNGQEDDGVLPIILQMLEEECDKGEAVVGEQTYSVAVQTLLRILRNVQKNPTEEKYRSIRLQNGAFAQKVWRHDGCQQFLQATGWVVVDESLYLTDDSRLAQAVTELEKHAVAPQNSAQAATVQPETSRPKTKEMTEARQKQLEQMKKEKEERQRIADQIRADRQETNSRPMRDIRARERHFGAQIKRFEDIGVDLNGGGG